MICLFKRAARVRLNRMKQKQKVRLERVTMVHKDLQKWSDMPLSWTFTSYCDKLKIKPNAAAKKFIVGLCIPGVDLQKEAKKLPLEF